MRVLTLSSKQYVAVNNRKSFFFNNQERSEEYLQLIHRLVILIADIVFTKYFFIFDKIYYKIYGNHFKALLVGNSILYKCSIV